MRDLQTSAGRWGYPLWHLNTHQVQAGTLNTIIQVNFPCRFRRQMCWRNEWLHSWEWTLTRRQVYVMCIVVQVCANIMHRPWSPRQKPSCIQVGKMHKSLQHCCHSILPFSHESKQLPRQIAKVVSQKIESCPQCTVNKDNITATDYNYKSHLWFQLCDQSDWWKYDKCNPSVVMWYFCDDTLPFELYKEGG